MKLSQLELNLVTTNQGNTRIKCLIVLGQPLSDPEDLKKYLIKDHDDGKYYCTICNAFSDVKITNAKNHVESKHFPGLFLYTCDVCNETFLTKTNLNNHKARKHRTQKL